MLADCTSVNQCGVLLGSFGAGEHATRHVTGSLAICHIAYQKWDTMQRCALKSATSIPVYISKTHFAQHPARAQRKRGYLILDLYHRFWPDTLSIVYLYTLKAHQLSDHMSIEAVFAPRTGSQKNEIVCQYVRESYTQSDKTRSAIQRGQQR